MEKTKNSLINIMKKEELIKRYLDFFFENIPIKRFNFSDGQYALYYHSYISAGYSNKNKPTQTYIYSGKNDLTPILSGMFLLTSEESYAEVKSWAIIQFEKFNS